MDDFDDDDDKVLEPPEGEYTVPAGSVDLVLHMVTREEWRAKEPKDKRRLKHPLKVVLDHFTYTEPCNTYEECVKAVQDMQKEDMANGLSDIKYNFLVGGDGGIYQGRSWHVTSSKQLPQFNKINRRRLDIAYIGDFTGGNVPEIMQSRYFEIINFGKKYNMIKRFYNTISVRGDEEVELKVESTNSNDSKEKETVGNEECSQKEDVNTDKTEESSVDVKELNIGKSEQEEEELV